MTTESAAWTWKDIVTRLRDEPIDTVVLVAVSAIEEPASAGLHPMPTGADGRPVFGTLLDHQMGFLVQVSGENYEARLCRLPQLAASPPTAPPPALRQAVAPQSPASQASSPTAPQKAAPPSLTPPLPTVVPVLVESRTELVVQRQREPSSLAYFPAEQPGATMLMTTLFGTLLGAAFGGAKGAMTGALIGGGAGLASIAVSTAATSPATALAAQTMFLGLASASLGGRSGGQVLRLNPVRQPARSPLLDDGISASTRRLPGKK